MDSSQVGGDGPGRPGALGGPWAQWGEQSCSRPPGGQLSWAHPQGRGLAASKATGFECTQRWVQAPRDPPWTASPSPHPVCAWAPQCGTAQAGPRVLAADVDAFNLLLEMKLKRRRERPHLPRTVTELVAEDGSRVYVVGTAHFSDDSKKDVVKVTAALPV